MFSYRRFLFHLSLLGISAVCLAAPARGMSAVTGKVTGRVNKSANDSTLITTPESIQPVVGTTTLLRSDQDAPETIAQGLPSDDDRPRVLSPADLEPNVRPSEPLPATPLPQLPPVDELLDESGDPNTPDGVTSGSEETFELSGIELAGSSIFTTDDFAELFATYIGRPITFNELLQLRSAVTRRYVEEGFLTTGAFIPPQTLEGGVVTVQVLEGVIEEIEIVGTRRLDSDYIRSRLGLAAQPPINADELLEGLQRLQIDPLIETVSADLQAGVRPGTSILRVEVTEADSFDVDVAFDNGRSPNVGSFSREISISEGNLFGIGDRIALSYSNTDGSNNLDLAYAIPVSPYNTRLRFQAGIGESRIIGEPFDILDISSDAFQYSVGIDHPLIETPSEELTLGLALAHKETQTRLGIIPDIGPFALSPGADANGETRVSALQFTQQWTKRSSQQVFAARSQFNLGLDILNASRNENAVNEPETAPDSQFFSWRGQGQWVRLLGDDALFFLRSDVQLATDSLLSAEQFGLGGQQTVRGYRQNALLRDNGALVSAEARFPIIRFAENSIVQITPFLDVGTAWNYRGDSDENFLAGTGFGFLWEQNENLSARVDWGIPLVNIDDGENNTLQDSGIYFSLRYNLF